ncbi:hypothetical protein CEXT_589181 [Caerostris extrusa]|uniref:Uncharacterized protein n=1 Tax=Caerostris extrusa TaxID=172846 RepID=A0AAV4T932_CAEEX|nr:hypothetical protein CEXT_589181 [Caerostris extrusa]
MRLWIVRNHRGDLDLWCPCPDGRAKDGLRLQLRCTKIIIVFGLFEGLRGFGGCQKGRVSNVRTVRCAQLPTESKLDNAIVDSALAGAIWICARPTAAQKDGLRLQLRCTAMIIVFGLFKGLRGLWWLPKGRVSKR